MDGLRMSFWQRAQKVILCHVKCLPEGCDTLLHWGPWCESGCLPIIRREDSKSPWRMHNNHFIWNGLLETYSFQLYLITDFALTIDWPMPANLSWYSMLKYPKTPFLLFMLYSGLHVIVHCICSNPCIVNYNWESCVVLYHFIMWYTISNKSFVFSGSTLLVRRGSEPALNNLGTEPGGLTLSPIKASKRSSTVASINGPKVRWPLSSMGWLLFDKFELGNRVRSRALIISSSSDENSANWGLDSPDACLLWSFLFVLLRLTTK